MTAKNFCFGAVAGGATVGMGYYGAAHTDVVRFTGFTPAELLPLIAPLFLATLFIERTVEVFISAPRDLGNREHKAAVETAKGVLARAGAGSTNDSAASNLEDAEKKLRNRRAGTRRHAFLASVVLGFLAAALGLRALGLFLDPGEFADLREGQRIGFTLVDILLTAGLLAGGADGFHPIVNRLKTFFGDSNAGM